MEEMYKKVVSLDTLFSEYEEILARSNVIEFRTKAAVLLGNDQEQNDLIQEKEQLDRVESLVIQEILSQTNTPSLEEARKTLFKMKAVLNEYSSRVGEEYALETLSPLSVDDLSRITFDQTGVMKV